MNKGELARRYVIVIAAQFMIALGITFTVLTNTGTTPLSTIPNVLAIRFPILTFGTYSFLWSVFLILIQVVLKGKKFQLIELLQVPFIFVFSVCLDCTDWLFSWINCDAWYMKVFLILIGCFFVSVGISMEVSANVVIGCGEAVVSVIAELIHKSFSFTKNMLDILYVIVGIILSFLFFGKLESIGLGTVFLGLCTGLVIRLTDKLIQKPLDCFYHLGESKNK